MLTADFEEGEFSPQMLVDLATLKGKITGNTFLGDDVSKITACGLGYRC